MAVSMGTSYFNFFIAHSLTKAPEMGILHFKGLK